MEKFVGIPVLNENEEIIGHVKKVEEDGKILYELDSKQREQEYFKNYKPEEDV